VLANAVTIAALAAAGRTTPELMSFAPVPAITTVFAFGVVCESFADHPNGLPARPVVGAALALLVFAALPVWQLVPEAAAAVLVAHRLATATLFCAWAVSALRGGYERRVPRLFAAAIVGTLPLLGGANAVIAVFDADVHLHDTYFVVGRFHLEMDILLLAFLGGLHLWWPPLTGRAESGAGGWVGPALLWAGMMTTAIAQLALGHEGMPRRYYAYLPEYEGLHRAATIGAGLQALALVWIAARLARTPASPDMPSRT
jgi:heme/copper-type cytochrome/quinol oxidase subunit 1